jgi:uncharacterized membrane protein
MSDPRTYSINSKRAFFIFFGLMTLFVIYRYELPLLDSNSLTWQHFANVKFWLIPHGVAGAIALLLAPFQFSSRLRQRHLRLHRVMGRLYVCGVALAAPSSIPIAVILGPPSLVMAAVMQSIGWALTTGIALYCVRTGNIQQHREWMIRSYPFAMVFVFARAIMALPPIQAMGEVGFISVVWSCEVAASFIPSLVISWGALSRRKAAPAARLKAAA